MACDVAQVLELARLSMWVSLEDQRWQYLVSFGLSKSDLRIRVEDSRLIARFYRHGFWVPMKTSVAQIKKMVFPYAL